MTELNITEAVSIQLLMVRHAEEIGWTPISPEAALRKRESEAGMLWLVEKWDFVVH